MKLLKILALLGLVAIALAQTEVPETGGEGEGETTTAPPEDGGERGGRRGKAKNPKLNCTAVECDQAVLTECEKPVLFLGDSCCPVCPMTDVCDTVECGEGEVCSEQDGEAVCCTDKTAELRRTKKNVLKALRKRFGFERCSRQKEGRTGVNRGPCRNNSCDEDEVCVAVLRRAFCCPRPESDSDIPPCEGAAAVQTSFLGRCHAPNTTLSNRPRPAGDCRCRLNRRGRRPNRPRPTEASTEEEEEEEPTDVTSTGEGDGSDSNRQGRRQGGSQNQGAGRRQGGKQGSGRRQGGDQNQGSNRQGGKQNQKRGPGGRQSPSGRRPGRRPFGVRCRCGYNSVKRFLHGLHKARKQIQNCRPDRRQ